MSLLDTYKAMVNKGRNQEHPAETPSEHLDELRKKLQELYFMFADEKINKELKSIGFKGNDDQRAAAFFNHIKDKALDITYDIQSKIIRNAKR